MHLLVDNHRLPHYLEQVEDHRPTKVQIQGLGRHVGKAAWLALVLEDEQGYRQKALNLDRVVEDGSADRARLTITLEGTSGGAGRQEQSISSRC